MTQERSVRVERKLSAILAADVAGYSRLMHHAEEATHARLTTLLVDGVEPAIAEHGGRIVKRTGDGLLAEFPSAVEAVRAAVQFQTRVRELTAGDAEASRISFRVGVNIGDVIVEPHDIFGDGVNIAARLEGIAEPGGICISSAAYDQVRDKVTLEVTDLGEQNLKNIARPVRTYAVVWDGVAPAARTEHAEPGLASPPRLSIVVLPFDNLSGDPEQDYFVDGVVESLTTDLSRVSGSFVIARNTAFSYKNKSIDVRRVGRELNVRYALEGSVQRGGNRLRVNVQLIDAETGKHLWAERFDRPVTDLFEMQDEIVSRLANTLNVQLMSVEARRSQRSLHPDALDLIFQGTASIYRGMTPENMAEARGFFQQVLALDPGNVDGLVGTAVVDATIGGTFMADDAKGYLASAEAFAIKALSLAPDNALAHMILGAVQIATNRATIGMAECEQALVLDHNLAVAHALMGWAKYMIGRGEETEAHVLQATRLSPRDPFTFRWMMYVGSAKLHAGADDEAVAWLRRGIEANRNFAPGHFYLAAALALRGQQTEAQAAAQAGLALNPGFSIRRYRSGTQSDHPAYLAGRERLYRGMRMAGVPEG